MTMVNDTGQLTVYLLLGLEVLDRVNNIIQFGQLVGDVWP
jgi:hypothetical protein